MHSLQQAVIFLATAVFLVPLFRRLKLGSVLGYLAAGALIGPWGLRLIGDVETTLEFAELGVVLLLFLVGLELEPSRLWAQRRPLRDWGLRCRRRRSCLRGWASTTSSARRTAATRSRSCCSRTSR